MSHCSYLCGCDPDSPQTYRNRTPPGLAWDSSLNLLSVRVQTQIFMYSRQAPITKVPFKNLRPGLIETQAGLELSKPSQALNLWASCYSLHVSYT